MLTLVSRTMPPDLSDAALSRHFADVAEMAGGEQNWRMAEAFIALAYMSAEDCAMTTFRFWRKRHSGNGIRRVQGAGLGCLIMARPL